MSGGYRKDSAGQEKHPRSADFSPIGDFINKKTINRIKYMFTGRKDVNLYNLLTRGFDFRCGKHGG